ncbi:acyltransferase family protein [Pseudomonas sp. NY15364]|uniref:acyltransferase family protein n=1 Tax=Pseudomonas sp. NY15364 TaxID=3400353 RepID=UPI003A879DDD
MSTQARIDQIQVLRGVAALLVVFSHVHFIGKGAFGVDIFFCISGFIMMYVTQRDTSHFITKRAIRIFPLYWALTLFLFLIATAKPNLFRSAEASFEFLAKSIFFIPFDRNGYIEPLLGPGWTLNYEIFFYLIFFASLKTSHKYRMEICSTTLILIVTLGKTLEPTSIPLKFFTQPIILEFALGMAIFKAFEYTDKKSIPKHIKTALAASSIAALLYLLQTTIKNSPEDRFFQWGIPAFVFSLGLILLLRDSKPIPSLMLLGDMSYSLYLTHIFIILGIDRLITSLTTPTLHSSLAALLAITLSIMIAYITWRFFETPIDRKLRKIFIGK